MLGIEIQLIERLGGNVVIVGTLPRTPNGELDWVQILTMTQQLDSDELPWKIIRVPSMTVEPTNPPDRAVNVVRDGKPVAKQIEIPYSIRAREWFLCADDDERYYLSERRPTHGSCMAKISVPASCVVVTHGNIEAVDST